MFSIGSEKQPSHSLRDIPKASIRIEPRAMIALLTAGKFPNSTDFLTSKLEPNLLSLDDAITKLDPFHHDLDGDATNRGP